MDAIVLISILIVVAGGAFLFLRADSEEVKATETQSTKSVGVRGISVYSYSIISKSSDPVVFVREKATLKVRLKNTGNTIWLRGGDNPVFLGASRPADRETLFYQGGLSGWSSGNRVIMDDSMVYPGQQVDFVFEVKAPTSTGVYREYFTPLVEYITWMEDKGIHWDIEVRDPNKPDEKLALTINGLAPKYIKIKLGEQRLYVYEEGLLKYNFIVSTGRPGMDTPKGKFKIWNKFPTQYSSQYQLFMDNWMAITQSGSYGIHSLPYWKVKSGAVVYEDQEHLGTKISHGCVRLDVPESKTLYDWAEVGVPVYIEN